MKSSKDWVQIARDYDKENPEFAWLLHEISINLQSKYSLAKCSIEYVIEKARWEHKCGINQNLAKGYKTILEERFPELKGFFNNKKNLHKEQFKHEQHLVHV